MALTSEQLPPDWRERRAEQIRKDAAEVVGQLRVGPRAFEESYYEEGDDDANE